MPMAPSDHFMIGLSLRGACSQHEWSKRDWLEPQKVFNNQESSYSQITKTKEFLKHEDL